MAGVGRIGAGSGGGRGVMRVGSDRGGWGEGVKLTHYFCTTLRFSHLTLTCRHGG